jgi:hypothetical protein
MFWEVVGLERGPLSLMSTIEELLERESSGSGLEMREYGRRDPSRWPRGTLYPQKLALASRSLGRYSSLADSGNEVFFFPFPSTNVRTENIPIFENWILRENSTAYVFCRFLLCDRTVDNWVGLEQNWHMCVCLWTQNQELWGNKGTIGI